MNPSIPVLRSERSLPSAHEIPDCPEQLAEFGYSQCALDLGGVVEALRLDRAVLLRNVDRSAADAIMGGVAEALGLVEKLETQAAFAEIQGHRRRVGKYFMTVNRRRDFAIVLPHSEGTRLQGIQLAALYCQKNSTDGGVSVLLNVDQEGSAWGQLKELVARLDPNGRPLTATQRAIARAKYMAVEYPGPEDVVIEERPSGIEGVRFVWVLAPVRRSFSQIAQANVLSYWDNVASVDADAVEEGVRLMKSLRLMRGPVDGGDDYQDHGQHRTVWSSGTSYRNVFKAAIVYKLMAGDLLIQNNYTWAHAASNWTPGSGTREIFAAFA